MGSRLIFILIALATGLGSCSKPELFVLPWNKGSQVMVAAAHPQATEAGIEILQMGGSAVDAAVAIEAVLTVVEPQSSGIGGGAFLLYWDPVSRQVKSYDGRETAPASLKPTIFLDDEGKPKSFIDQVLGGKSVGIPGAVAMLGMAHEKHGNLPWEDLFAPAIRLADQGYAISPSTHLFMTKLESARRMPDTRALFTDEGVPLQPGTIITNPELAGTFRRIAKGGPGAFYEGDIPEAIIKRVETSPVNPTRITLADFRAYAPKERKPVCNPYRQWTVCGMGPPTSGGMTVLQILGMLETFDLSGLTPGGVEAVHLISEAQRLAYADRDRYMADSDHVAVPVNGLTDRDYLKERAKLIDQSKARKGAAPGNPPEGRQAQFLADDRSYELPSTSHFSVVDGQGGVVSMTASIEFIFGSHLMAGGFLLNNELTDFSAIPEMDGRPIANAAAPGKRPRSSMSPTLVFDETGDLYLAIGSPGGSRIIGYVSKTLIGVLDWNLDVQSAINLPNHINRNGKTEIEVGPNADALGQELEALGHDVVIREMRSGLHGIRITRRGLDGGADPRGIGTFESARVKKDDTN